MNGGRRQWLRCALGVGAGAWAAPAAAAGLQWRERALLGFGTTLWLRAGHADGARADAPGSEAGGEGVDPAGHVGQRQGDRLAGDGLFEIAVGSDDARYRALAARRLGAHAFAG